MFFFQPFKDAIPLSLASIVSDDESVVILTLLLFPFM